MATTDSDEAYKVAYEAHQKKNVELARQPEPLRRVEQFRLVAHLTLECGHIVQAYMEDQPRVRRPDGTFDLTLRSPKDQIECRECLAESICTCPNSMRELQCHRGECPVMYMSEDSDA